MPVISVIVPTYNSERTIDRCVLSVLNQTLSDFELIVVDDQSTDGTVARLSRITDPRVSVLVQPQNNGVSAARNRGIAAAQADILCFLDSDDEYLPNKLSIVYSFFTEHPSIDVLIDSFEIHFPEPSGKPPKRRLNPELNDSESVRQAVYCREIFKATPALTIRRKTLAAAGLFDEGMQRREDMELLIRLTHVANCVSRSDILWHKHALDHSLSWPVDTFMMSLIDVAIRHDEYIRAPAYRCGLARDLTRHFLRLLRKRHLGTVARDFATFGQRFGPLREIGLVFEGFREMRRRRLRT